MVSFVLLGLAIFLGPSKNPLSAPDLQIPTEESALHERNKTESPKAKTESTRKPLAAHSPESIQQERASRNKPHLQRHKISPASAEIKRWPQDLDYSSLDPSPYPDDPPGGLTPGRSRKSETRMLREDLTSVTESLASFMDFLFYMQLLVVSLILVAIYFSFRDMESIKAFSEKSSEAFTRFAEALEQIEAQGRRVENSYKTNVNTTQKVYAANIEKLNKELSKLTKQYEALARETKSERSSKMGLVDKVGRDLGSLNEAVESLSQKLDEIKRAEPTCGDALIAWHAAFLPDPSYFLSDEIRQMPLDELKVSGRCKTGFQKAGVKTVGQLIDFGEARFRSLDNIGNTTMDGLMDALLSVGATFNDQVLRLREWQDKPPAP